jgi:hypothetical protein
MYVCVCIYIYTHTHIYIYMWLLVSCTLSILYFGHMTFDLHKTSSGMQLGHKTRPGHCNMQHWRFSSDWSCMCVSWSLAYSTLFQWLTAPHLQSWYSAHALYSWVPLGIQGTCMSEVQAWKVGTIICQMEYITLSFLTFFQFGENTQKIMDGVTQGRMCAGCVDIDHSCTKAPWV